MTVNLNDYIAVRLTEHGEKVWADDWKDTIYKGTVPDRVRNSATLPDGRVKFQLWYAMQLFGPLCYTGNSNLPFVGNEVEIRDPPTATEE